MRIRPLLLCKVREKTKMDGNILYPYDNLHTTVTTQRTAINNTWQLHQSHLQQNILTPASQLMKEAAEPFQQHINDWNQTLEEHYQAFHTFLDLLHTGTTDMQTQDTAISQGFHNKTQP